MTQLVTHPRNRLRRGAVHVSEKPKTADKKKRRARDSNPQPVARHLISSEAASQFAYPPDRFGIVAYPAAAGERHSEAHCDLCARIGKVKHYSSLIASILRTPQEFV